MTLENGTSKDIADMPDDVANVVDEWLSELETDDKTVVGFVTDKYRIIGE